jgi:Immunity protein 74
LIHAKPARPGTDDYAERRIGSRPPRRKDFDDPAGPSQRRGPSDFIVELDRVLSWDLPHGNIRIEIAELRTFVQAIEAEFERLGLVVEVDYD